MKILLIIIFFLAFPNFAFSQLGESEIDNIYGEYLIQRSKKKISMDLEEVYLVDLLKIISQQSGLNFISTEAVEERKITLYIEDAPLKEAIDVIFKANNLTYDYYPKANMFVVKEMGKPGIELKTKVYRLKYIQVQGTKLQTEAGELLGTKGGTGIAELLQNVLTEHGKVVEDVHTNSLIVVDVPSQFPVIDEVIRKLDVPQPKVLIEVEMLDVKRSLVDKLGANWSAGIKAVYNAPGPRGTGFPFPKRFWGGQKPSSLTFGTFSLASTQAIIEFLSTDTSTKYLARPKLLTLAGETAEINLTTDEAVGVTTTIEEGVTTYSIERAETGTKLRVTPQVDLLNGEITLAVEVVNKTAEKSEVTIYALGDVVNPEERGAKCVLRLKDGETLLIGGLIREDKSNSQTKVPFLSDVPLLGALFRHKSKEDTQRELLIFITPHIMEEKLGVSKIIPREQSGTISLRQRMIEASLDRFSKK
jgi:type II secretory pathway component GspD/PulD (secretin)